jgi:hypothetical protein
MTKHGRLGRMLVGMHGGVRVQCCCTESEASVIRNPDEVFDDAHAIGAGARMTARETSTAGVPGHGMRWVGMRGVV